ncbi:hypothetical protein [Arthrobacter sp. STN4]|uniref:hypothetical protein n=1 Tax=Arthrobacter sp. STN4 TaxID=2923276 RepID=UPI00211A3C9D|nr:hypothetical protein [Arthrobacter sp. STN4]MCQ9162610.1 hypothetical protein [Arthrobacter sp. STN4]
MKRKAPYSQHAQTMLRTTHVLWGAILDALALFFLVLGLGGSSAGWLVPAVILAAIGVPVLLTGLNARRRAMAFNETDFTYSRRIDEELSALSIRPHESAFGTDSSCVSVHAASVVELERHFDQETSGAIVGGLEHAMKMFARSTSVGAGHLAGSGNMIAGNAATMRGFINGVSNAHLTMSSTTRSNLLGDALFSVLEFTGRDGNSDTMRLVSMSGPAATQWMGDLIQCVSQSLGGPATHTGHAVAQWIQPLVGNYTPRDISYTTDRLKAMERHQDMTLQVASGQLVGRNAMLATEIQFSGGTVTRLFPHKFPTMFGDCIGRATRTALELPGAADAAAVNAGGTPHP